MNFSIKRFASVLWVGMAFAVAAAAAESSVLVGVCGDQGDGTYRNPVIPADYSDLDAIRVGDDFYAMSSTFQFSPGVVILQSKDLVNWRILGHAVADLTQIGPELNWNRMNRYGKGIWAGAIRHHAGKFWIYFGTPDEGYFMTTAANPAGPWEPLTKVLGAPGWDDCCPFWDDDGQGYLVGSNFAKDPATGKAYNIHLWKLTPDGKGLVPGSDTIIHQSRGSEANKLYKINGFYYHYYSEVKGEGRVVMMNRSKSLSGPWETRQLNHAEKEIDPNQGGLIELADGRWWFFTHFGTGCWAGRQANLLPVTWVDGWPILGKPDANGIGSMVWAAEKPIKGFPVTSTVSHDEFNAPELRAEWEWNYQPRPEKWSLAERPGFLRLQAFKPLRPGDLFKAGNTLTQRSLCCRESCEVTVKLDIGGMADGQHAGLCHFAKTRGSIGVKQAAGIRRLVLDNNGAITEGPVLAGNDLWLRSQWGVDGNSRFFYSLDGRTFTALGTPYPLSWGNYRGDRIGIFCYNDEAEKGWLDIDWFHYNQIKPTDKASGKKRDNQEP